MEDLVSEAQASIDWSVAARPVNGQRVSGDLHLVKPFDHGVLLAVIDGVGHGEEAQAAAHLAAEVLNKHALEPTITLIKRCHQELVRTRGVVLTVAKLQLVEKTMTWLGVGNVEGRLFRADARASHPSESVLMRSGLVGYQLPALQASVLPLVSGDVLIMATDGIDASFEAGIHLNEKPKQMADRILSEHFKGNDDALVLVARYLGKQHE
jgi:phosphoserine phosphatase RsbX